MDINELKNIFSSNLTSFMKTKQISQAQLGKRMAKKSSTISNWCTGMMIPRMDMVIQISEILEVDVADLFEEHKKHKVPVSSRFQEEINNLDKIVDSLLLSLTETNNSEFLKIEVLQHFQKLVLEYQNLAKTVMFSPDTADELTKLINDRYIHEIETGSILKDATEAKRLLQTACTIAIEKVNNHTSSLPGKLIGAELNELSKKVDISRK